MPLKLGVNIDHVATLRQARYAAMLDSSNCEPDLAAAASVCERAGAHGITIHLREDRRHIQDRDVKALRKSVRTKLNLELGNSPEILDLACKLRPDEACLVPENRAEITTEGGLDVAQFHNALRPAVAFLRDAGVRVSMFIEPSPEQIEASKALGADMVELHTGAFANASGKEQGAQLERLVVASQFAHCLGLQVNAGHGINYGNIAMIRSVPHLAELNIGHAIVSRAVFTGLGAAVASMLAAMNRPA